MTKKENDGLRKQKINMLGFEKSLERCELYIYINCFVKGIVVFMLSVVERGQYMYFVILQVNDSSFLRHPN